MAITDPFNAANTQSCNYTHDDLARLATANCGSGFSDTYTYDAFGNLTKSGTYTFNPGYNSSNQMGGTTYDAKGDVLTDSLHSYAWDVETRPTTIDSISVTYDALGRMVEQAKSGSHTEIVYDALGNKLALMNGKSTIVKVFAPLPGGATAVYNASGLQYYRHSDWLGGSRFASTPSRTMYNDLAYTPFGIPYAQAGTTGVANTSFAGNNEDTTTSLYDAMFREYEIYGRWPSPDPAGIAAANPANPQSWNRYAYVLNMPTIFIDPFGLDDERADIPRCLIDGVDVGVGLCYGLFGGGGFGGGSGGGGRVDFGHLVGQTLVALLNPNCAALFGGYQNATDAILNSSYNMYSPDETNPYPTQVSSRNWDTLVNNFASNDSQYGETQPSTTGPGGITFFGNGFASLAPGFAAPFTYQVTQETGFLHELEHASTFYYDPALSSTIDNNSASYVADALKLNSGCAPQQFQTTPAPIGTTLIPPN